MKEILINNIVAGAFGGVIASLISGYFNLRNSKQISSNIYLSKDIEVLREIIDNINKNYLMHLSDQHFNICQTDKLLEEIERLYLYLDFNNKYAQTLYCEYKKVYKIMKTIEIEYGEVLDSLCDDVLDFNEFPKFMAFVVERKKNVNNLKKLIRNYFSTYYPKNI